MMAPLQGCRFEPWLLDTALRPPMSSASRLPLRSAVWLGCCMELREKPTWPRRQPRVVGTLKLDRRALGLHTMEKQY